MRQTTQPHMHLAKHAQLQTIPSRPARRAGRRTRYGLVVGWAPRPPSSCNPRVPNSIVVPTYGRCSILWREIANEVLGPRNCADSTAAAAAATHIPGAGGMGWSFLGVFFVCARFCFCGWLVSARTVPLLQAVARKT